MREVLILIAMLGTAFGGAIGLSIGITAWECAGYERATGKATRMTAGTCYVQDNGSWYHWDEYKHRLVTKGEMK